MCNSECVWCSSYLQVTVQITEQLWRQTYSEHCQISKTEHFAKKNNNNNNASVQPEIFQGKGGRAFVERGHFDKHFVKNTRKRGPQGNILESFLLDTLKTTFWMKNLIQRWTQSGPSFPKSRHFFGFRKRQGRLHLSPSCPLVNVAEYTSVSLNIPNILENAWINCSDYARTLNLHDHLICPTGFRRCLKF